jgi:hypothetical protein
VQALQTQVVALQSVLKVTQTRATLQASSLSLLSSSDLTIQFGQGTAVTAGSGIAMRSGTSTVIKAGSFGSVEAAGTMDMKGSQLRLNGGNKPIAIVGNAVGNGMVLTGSPTLLAN